MAIPARPNASLAENIITLICHSDQYGKILVNTVTPELFEGDYREIADRAINYWHAHGEAPKAHTADLFGDIINDRNDRRAPTFRRIFVLMSELIGTLNPLYVMDSTHKHIRTVKIKNAILESADRINRKQEIAIEEVEGIWQDLLRNREIAFSPGLRLDNYERVLTYLEHHLAEFKTGVHEFNARHVAPARGAAFLFLGAAKRGKTWFLCDVGKQALMARQKVAHISLEISEEEVAQRYYQAMFAVSTREAKSKITTLTLDKYGLKGFGEEEVIPDFTFSSPYVRDELQVRIDHLGTRCGNIVIKQFPGRSLTINGLNAYLDQLESVEGFVPDLLILDYIGITKTDERNHRISLGRNFEEFRGTCVQRNIAGVTAHQISKKGETAHVTSSVHIAEDWSMIGTADAVVVYSQTASERRYGLARLFVTQVRSVQGNFGVLITQNYTLGQFCLESTLLDARYERYMEELVGSEQDDAEEPDEDDE